MVKLQRLNSYKAMVMCDFVLKRGNSTILPLLFLDREPGCCLMRLDRAFVVLFEMFKHLKLTSQITRQYWRETIIL